jgi:hypothetical protein
MVHTDDFTLIFKQYIMCVITVDVKFNTHDVYLNNLHRYRYAQYRNIGKPNNLFWGNKLKSLNRIVKMWFRKVLICINKKRVKDQLYHIIVYTSSPMRVTITHISGDKLRLNGWM